MERRNRTLLFLPLVFLLHIAGATPAMQAQPTSRYRSAWYEGFEGARTTWVVVGGDARYRLEVHRRVSGEARTGQSSEYFRFVTESIGGDRLYIAHDVGRPRVLESLSPSVQIKSNRGGLRLLAEVVLPRSIHPETKQPITTLIPSDAVYNNVGRWQRLAVEDIPLALQRRTWGLRKEYGPQVDPAGAYVNRILINAYAGPGATDVWLDDLDVAGYVAAFPDEQPWRPSPRAVAEPGAVRPGGYIGRNADSETSGPSPEQTTRPESESPTTYPLSPEDWERIRRPVGGGPLPGQRVAMSGGRLLVDGRPLLPRIIEYRNEPLALLKRLGFNTIWLASPPTPRLLDEARYEEMWIVCPPPQPAMPSHLSGSAAASTSVSIGPEYDRVLAWNVGRGLEEERYDDVARWIRQIRAADRERARPILCEARSGLLPYSRQVDLMMMGRRPLLTSLSIPEYANWLVCHQRLARPGTPIWTVIQTQPAPALASQWRAMSPDATIGAQAVTLDQIRTLLRAAFASGCRGLLFESNSPLDAGDEATRYRAAVLELINLELRLVEPWLAGGSVVGQFESSHPTIEAVVLQATRSRLVAPYSIDPDARHVADKAAAEDVSIVVPGVPEDYDAYLLLPGGPRPLDSSRPAGGTRISIAQCGPSSLVLLSQDALTIHQLTQRARAIGPRVVELRRQIAAMQLDSTRRVLDQLPALPSLPPAAEKSYLSLAARQLQTAATLEHSRDYASSYLRLERAAEPLRILQHAAWADVDQMVPETLSSPAVACFDSLPAHLNLKRRVQGATYGPDLLAAGDHEDLGAWLSAGWNHIQDPVHGVVAGADLAVAASRTGRMGLRIAARLEDSDKPVAWVRTAPVCIASPSVPIEAGSLICIHGWVQVPRPIEGSADGLMIVDSIGGEALASRHRVTDGWRQFTMYRYVPSDGRVSLSIALTGLGEAWLDDIRIQRIESPGPMAGIAPPGRRQAGASRGRY